MPVWGWALIGVGIAALLTFIVVRMWQRRELENRFGAEYERAVDQAGNRRDAESDLKDRERRRASLTIVELDERSRVGFAERWQLAQNRFVDLPADAVREADVLLIEVMRAVGYPIDDFEQRAADISVDHADVVDNYRAAHGTRERANTAGVSTEELRQAMVYYRALFEELLGEPVVPNGTFGKGERVVHMDPDEERIRRVG
jgi:hypothetical protein